MQPQPVLQRHEINIEDWHSFLGLVQATDTAYPQLIEFFLKRTSMCAISTLNVILPKGNKIVKTGQKRTKTDIFILQNSINYLCYVRM